MADALRLLHNLGFIAQGLPTYLRALSRDADEIVAFGAWCQLVDGGLVTPADYDHILQLCRHGAMRSRAFTYFSRRFDYERAGQVADTATPDPYPALMRAVTSHDPGRQVSALRDLYFAELRPAYLIEASRLADEAEGWAARAEWLCRAIALYPRDESTVQVLASHLIEAGQPDLVRHLCAALAPFAGYAPTLALIRAELALAEKRPADCLADLRRLEGGKGGDGQPAPLSAAGQKLRALALELTGEYRAAFLRSAVHRNAVHFPTGIPRAKADHIMMLGFPRSGKTLLENALAMHPDVETFNEIASFDRVERLLDICLAEEAGPLTAEHASALQAAYYDEIARRTSRLKVDKTPIRSAKAGLLAALFPGQRFVFSIRHPYDVVQSNVKQRYAPNPAMANFLDLSEAVRAYDAVMSIWFSTFNLDHEDGFYLRYDRLVTEFRATMSEVLEFLGLDWSESVLDFARGAEARAAKTPSYAKVRSGLGIGVQTSFQNYLFAFRAEDRKILDKWCQHFGYGVV